LKTFTVTWLDVSWWVLRMGMTGSQRAQGDATNSHRSVIAGASSAGVVQLAR
jgi:hypothetical protein